MKLIIGLGNPGEKYKNNRHNVGYLFVDKFNSSAQKLSNFKAVKTGIMMNDSGQAVKRLVGSHDLELTNLYIVHDDLDIPLGKYKLQLGKGPKDHNGIKSVNKALGTKDYWRIRVGIENRGDNPISGEEYTLQDFTSEEKSVIEGVMTKIIHEGLD